MNEEEFDELMPGQTFRSEDFMGAQAEAGRLTVLGMALWGRTSADLERRLQARYPEIPSDCTLTDLRRLRLYLQRLSNTAGKPQNAWTLIAGPKHFSRMEARFEIVRRAIEYLEKQ